VGTYKSSEESRSWKILENGKTFCNGSEEIRCLITETNGASGWDIRMKNGWYIDVTSTAERLVWRKPGDPLDPLVWTKVSFSGSLFQVTFLVHIS